MPRYATPHGSLALVLFLSLFAFGCDSGATDDPPGSDGSGPDLPAEAGFTVQLADGQVISLTEDLYAETQAYRLPDGSLMKRLSFYSEANGTSFSAEVPFRTGRHRLGTRYAGNTTASTEDYLTLFIGEDSFRSDPGNADNVEDGAYVDAYIELTTVSGDAIVGTVQGTLFSESGSTVEAISIESGGFRIENVDDPFPQVNDETEGAGDFPHDEGGSGGGEGSGGEGGGEEEEDVIADFEMLFTGPPAGGQYVYEVEFRFENQSENAVSYEWFVTGDRPETVERVFSTSANPPDQMFQPITSADTASVTVTLVATGADGSTDTISKTERFPMVRAFGTFTFDGETYELGPRFPYIDDYYFQIPESGGPDDDGVIVLGIGDGEPFPDPTIRISAGPLASLTSIRQTDEYNPQNDGTPRRTFYASIGGYQTFDDTNAAYSDGSIFFDPILADEGGTFVNLELEMTLRNANGEEKRAELTLNRIPEVCYVWPSSPFCFD